MLRARVTLEERPDNRAAAAAAIDRLLPQLEAPGTDPGGFRLLARCVWAHAAAALGDDRMFRRALASADPAAAQGRVSLRLRADVLLARAALAAGDAKEAAGRARAAREEASSLGFTLLAWEAERVIARAAGAPLPPPGILAVGMDAAETAALERR